MNSDVFQDVANRLIADSPSSALSAQAQANTQPTAAANMPSIPKKPRMVVPPQTVGERSADKSSSMPPHAPLRPPMPTHTPTDTQVGTQAGTQAGTQTGTQAGTQGETRMDTQEEGEPSTQQATHRGSSLMPPPMLPTRRPNNTQTGMPTGRTPPTGMGNYMTKQVNNAPQAMWWSHQKQGAVALEVRDSVGQNCKFVCVVLFALLFWGRGCFGHTMCSWMGLELCRRLLMSSIDYMCWCCRCAASDSHRSRAMGNEHTSLKLSTHWNDDTQRQCNLDVGYSQHHATTSAHTQQTSNTIATTNERATNSRRRRQRQRTTEHQYRYHRRIRQTACIHAGVITTSRHRERTILIVLIGKHSRLDTGPSREHTNAAANSQVPRLCVWMGVGQWRVQCGPLCAVCARQDVESIGLARVCSQGV
jgi:hypothetical protein